MDLQASDALVFFGATGDLAYKQIFPALHALVRRNSLNVPIIAVAKSGWTRDQLIERAKDSIQSHGGINPAAFDKLCSLLQYIDGDYADIATFITLRELLGRAQHPLHYLAVPPFLFGPVAAKLKESGCSQGARIAVEKPFGHDLASAKKLNLELLQYFPEASIFRIDHYLGKETVENLLYFRFANPLIASSWHNRDIEQIQITMAENFGVAGRGKFYDEVGALRDVVQNHMLQVLAGLALELPTGDGIEPLRDARGKLLQQVVALDPAHVVRAQFKGYRQEPGVAADSQVETFAAMRFMIDNDRWRGVPFYVRVGKSLPITATEVLIQFKAPKKNFFDQQNALPANYCRFRLSPQMVIALGTNVKKQGEKLEGYPVELVAHRSPDGEMQPYDRLIGDALKGDNTLFTREDFVEESWRIVDPVLGNATPLLEYEPNSWGPATLDTLLSPNHGWHNPSGEN